MAVIDPSIERLKARQAAGVNDELASKLEALDGLCGEKAGYVESLCQAIVLLTSDSGKRPMGAQRSLLSNLARQAAHWASELGNEVNAFAEDVGCNELWTRGDA